MTRKDYYLIAGAVAKCKSLGADNLEYVADMLATELAKDNDRFVRERFMKACGVENASTDDQETR